MSAQPTIPERRPDIGPSAEQAALETLLAMVANIHARVASMDERLAELEGLLEEYRPLLDMVKDRAGKSWRARFGTGGNIGGE